MLAQYLLRRVAALIPTLLAISLISFVVIRLLPGDPAQLMAGDFATEEDVQALRERYGLNQPVHEQYLIYLQRIAQADLGTSTRSNFPITEELQSRFLATIELTLAATVVAIVLGVTAGVISGVRPYSWFDNASMVVALIGVSTPIFWSGLLLLVLFSVQLDWLPSGGRGDLSHLILPAVTLGWFAAGTVARQTRASMLDAINQAYVTTARAKGLRENVVILRHALRNALIPIVTILGLQVGHMLGGSLLTETVFSWPGMGRYLVDAILTRDYPVVQGSILVFGTAFALTNLLVDVLYGVLDPRIGYR